MSTDQWLLLTDYSSKYRVSVSTLRRRIKNNQIPFRFENGKYLLIDASPNHPEVTAHEKPTPFFEGLKTLAVEPAPLKMPAESLAAFNEFSDQLDSDLGLPPRQIEPSVVVQEPQSETVEKLAPNHIYSGSYPVDDPSDSAVVGPEPLIATATSLLGELKRAYSNILQEKEEQMIQLKEEVSDLKTLVRVLEDETDRLRRQLNEYRRSFESANNLGPSTHSN